MGSIPIVSTVKAPGNRTAYGVSHEVVEDSISMMRPDRPGIGVVTPTIELDIGY